MTTNEPETIQTNQDQTEQIDPTQLPDLPELETVEAKTEDARLSNIVISAVVIAFMTLVTLFSLWCVVMTCIDPHAMTKHRLEACLVITGLMLVVFLLNYWVLSRLIKREHGWRTEENGLQIRKLFRKQFVRWDDVADAEIIWRKLKGPLLKLSTPQRTIMISTPALENMPIYLFIWQHLRRRGKSDNLPFPPSGEWLWHKVPEEVPEEMDWENPKPPSVLDAFVRCALWIFLIWFLVAYLSTRDRGPYGVAASLSILPLRLFWDTAIVFRRFTLRKDHFEATRLFGRTSSPWSKVKRVEFVPGYGTTLPSLILVLGWLKGVRVMWNPLHPNSTKLILAILQRLREQADLGPIPIPTILLEAMHDGGARPWNAR